MLSGGGALGSLGGDPVGLVTVCLEWGFLEPWGVSLEAGLQSLRTGADGPVIKASVLLQSATLAIRRGFFTHGLDGFHLSLGFQLVRMSAGATGTSDAHGVDVVAPAGAASVDWRVTSKGGLFFLARFGAEVRQIQYFTVTGLAKPLVTVPPADFALELGAGWNFF